MMAYEQFSSFQIGKMLNVSRQAVNQWIDKGYIHSYRTPGGHRRVRRDDLLEFLKSRQIPVPHALLQFTVGVAAAAPMTNAAFLTALPQAQGPLVVLIDEDTDFTSLLVGALRKRHSGVEFLAFNNSMDALLAIGNHLPDMIILDLELPHVEGLDLCRRLKQNDATREIPIAVVTGRESAETRGALARLGIDALWSKNNPFDEIVEKVSALIKNETTV